MERLRYRIVSALTGAILLPSTIFHQPAQEDRAVVLMCLNADISTNIRVISENELTINGQQLLLRGQDGKRLFVLGIGSRGAHEALFLHQTPDIFTLPNRIGPLDLRNYGSEDNIVSDTFRRGYLPRIVVSNIPATQSDAKELIQGCFENTSSLS